VAAVEGLPAKQLELAREVVPSAARIGVLANLSDPKAPPQLHEQEAAGQQLGVKVIVVDVSAPDDLDGAFRALADQLIDVMVVLQTSMLLSERRKIAGLAATTHLPAVYGYREHVDDGGLISYGVDLRACFRRAAYYVHKILNGVVPGDLPIEFPTRLELVINLKTAKALGLDVPATLLARADEVIERAFDAAMKEKVDAIRVGIDRTTRPNRQLIIDLAETNKIPAIYAAKEFVEDGGLMRARLGHRIF
jgi:putative tryptophan/tyrosine transport system substrate-binding protein